MKMPRVRVSKKQWIGIILLVIAIPLGIVIGITQGAIFQPGAPPEALTRGYAKISILDGIAVDEDLNPIPVVSSDLHLIFSDNMTVWQHDMTTGTTFYTPTGLVYFADIQSQGYYPVCGTVFASGGDDPAAYRSNIVYAFKRSDPSDISAQLIWWQDVSSGVYHYTPTTLPSAEGDYKIAVMVSIGGASKDKSVFGISAWVPDLEEFIPLDHEAHIMGLNFNTLWFEWTATSISQFRTVDPSWTYNDLSSPATGIFCSMNGPCYGSQATYIVQGHFNGLTSLKIFDGLIDNYNAPWIITVT